MDLSRSEAMTTGWISRNNNNVRTQQRDVLSKLSAGLSSVFGGGPGQHGFTAADKAALDTQAINAAGAANISAQQAARTYGAGQGGGGTSGVTSGITKQIESAIGSQSANQLATSQNQIAQADFNLGQQNYWRSVGGMENLAEQYNPSAVQSGAISDNAQSYQQASDINQQNNAVGQDIAGFATALAGSAGNIAKSVRG